MITCLRLILITLSLFLFYKVVYLVIIPLFETGIQHSNVKCQYSIVEYWAFARVL